jgi:FlaG/FlaF family flagellin (archaellin)
MRAGNESRDAAVSPVIGVMLMLVVTIIIAAVVSSFAGGLGTTKDTTPTVTFKADLSVADGLTITCLGATPGKNVEFDVCVGDSNYYRVGTGTTSTFAPGTSLTFDADELDQGFVAAYGDFKGYTGTGMYVPNDQFVGKTYTIQLIDENTGIIGKAYAVLTA